MQLVLLYENHMSAVQDLAQVQSHSQSPTPNTHPPHYPIFFTSTHRSTTARHLISLIKSGSFSSPPPHRLNTAKRAQQCVTMERSAMEESHETAPPNSVNGPILSQAPQPTNSHYSSSVGHEAIPSAFVAPADLLKRPQHRTAVTPPKTERPIDRDERAGLVSDCHHMLSHRLAHSIAERMRGADGEQKKIRDFLRLRNCYEVLPLSFRLIELDVGLTVKESLNILVQCGGYTRTQKRGWHSQCNRDRLCATMGLSYLHLCRPLDGQ